MKKIIVLALVASAALLAGCKEEAKSYDWYSSHPKETYTVYSECVKTGEASLNCEGARRAALAFSRGEDEELVQKFTPLINKR